MSYSFGMFFSPASSLSRALKKAQKFVEIQGTDENIKQLLKSERFYLPSSRHIAGTEREKVWLQEADRRAVDGFCTLNFVYFHNTKLLALVGNSYIGAEKFFKKHICFQNSCDQDYERTDWKGIKLFETIWDECAALTAEQLHQEECYQERTVEEIEKNIQYLQRSLAYDRIYELLGLDKWLYGHDDEKFTRFSMNLLTTQEKRWMAQDYVDCIRI